jgi:short-subunit dehydrogenase
VIARLISLGIVLVSNAGTASLLKFWDMVDLKNFSSTFNANITPAAALANISLPLLRQPSNPKVINISSGCTCTPGLRMGRCHLLLWYLIVPVK